MKRPPIKAVVGPQELVFIDDAGARFAGYRVINPPAAFPAVKASRPVDVRLSCAF